MTSLGKGTCKIIGTKGAPLGNAYKTWCGGNCQLVVPKIKVVDEIFEFLT